MKIPIKGYRDAHVGGTYRVVVVSMVRMLMVMVISIYIEKGLISSIRNTSSSLINTVQRALGEGN